MVSLTPTPTPPFNPCSALTANHGFTSWRCWLFTSCVIVQYSVQGCSCDSTQTGRGWKGLIYPFAPPNQQEAQESSLKQHHRGQLNRLHNVQLRKRDRAKLRSSVYSDAESGSKPTQRSRLQPWLKVANNITQPRFRHTGRWYWITVVVSGHNVEWNNVQTC